MFSDKCTKKSIEFKNIVDYISSYQATFDKVASLVKAELQIQRETIKIFLQANIVQNLGSK